MKITQVKSFAGCGTDTPAKTEFYQTETGAIVVRQVFLVDLHRVSEWTGEALVLKKYKDKVLFERVVGLKGETFASFLTACIQKGILSTNEKQ